MKFGFITFIVKDLDATVDFYQKVVHLQVVRRFNPGIGEICFMQNAQGETQLEFIQMDDPNAPTVNIVGMGMSFEVDGNLDEMHAQLAAQGYDPQPIYEGGPQPRNFKLLDPDGVMVEITEA